MSNPWLIHVKQFQALHPKLSYKECMTEAKATYKPSSGSGKGKAVAVPVAKKSSGKAVAVSVPVLVVKKSAGRPKKSQTGGNPLLAAAAIAPAVSQTVGALTDLSKNVTDAVQTNKAKSGRYDKANFDKKTAEFKRTKGLMAKGHWPGVSDAEIMAYIEKNYGL